MLLRIENIHMKKKIRESSIIWIRSFPTRIYSRTRIGNSLYMRTNSKPVDNIWAFESTYRLSGSIFNQKSSSSVVLQPPVASTN